MQQGWQEFRDSEPGHRFEDRYHRRQQREQGWLDPGRLFNIVGGLAIAVGSIVLWVVPGPGALTFFLGLGMIASEFAPVARLLDWAELKARKLGRRLVDTWRSSAAGKLLLVLGSLIAVAALGYGAYYLLSNP